eukprot:2031528-Rhodomonas_salina.4
MAMTLMMGTITRATRSACTPTPQHPTLVSQSSPNLPPRVSVTPAPKQTDTRQSPHLKPDKNPDRQPSGTRHSLP